MIGETCTSSHALALLYVLVSGGDHESQGDWAMASSMADLVEAGFVREIRTERNLYFGITDAGAKLLSDMLMGATSSQVWVAAYDRLAAKRSLDLFRKSKASADEHVWDRGICVNCGLFRSGLEFKNKCEGLKP